MREAGIGTPETSAKNKNEAILDKPRIRGATLTKLGRGL